MPCASANCPWQAREIPGRQRPKGPLPTWQRGDAAVGRHALVSATIASLAVKTDMAEAIKDYGLTSHAAFELERRGIGETVVGRVLAAPEQRHAVRAGRDVLQSRIAFEAKTYLVRVFVDVDREPAEVVTVYRTSNVAKYWRNEA